MLDLEQLREELSCIPGARLDFEPDVPPRIPLRYVKTKEAEQIQTHGRRPHIVVDSPRKKTQDGLETEAVFKRIDEDVVGASPQSRISGGIDALAWYASFHNLEKQWGIFIPESSVWYVTERWFGSWRTTTQKKLEIAFQVLYEHELFHYAADLNVAQWELMIGTPCWAPYRQETRARQGYCQLEEQLANAYMLRILAPRLPEAATAELLRAIGRQPPGYCDAEKMLKDSLFDDGLTELSKRHVGIQALRAGVNLASLNLPLERLFGVSPIFEGVDCPLYLIRDADRIGRGRIDVSLFDRIPAIQESRDFSKQLERMPQDVSKRWERKKRQMSQGLPSFPEFERMKAVTPATYSVRLGTNFRAHLRPEPSYKLWTAIAVGTHKRMGHG